MIPRPAITAWGLRAGWPTVEQIEQDLLLSRFDRRDRERRLPRAGARLPRGDLSAQGSPARGTALQRRLDYVRRSSGGIAAITRAAGAIGERLGMEVRTQMSAHPKVFLRSTYESGAGRMRIKVEVNTFERFPARPVVRVPYRVDSSWFTGSADVLTFALDELVATKIRALYQRSKGRDLFDLWLALTRLGVAPADLIESFAPYRPDGYTRALAVVNLRRSCAERTFAPTCGR